MKQGDHVRNPNKPEWGVGEIWKLEADDRAEVLFEDGKNRKLSLSLASLELVTIRARPPYEPVLRKAAPPADWQLVSRQHEDQPNKKEAAMPEPTMMCPNCHTEIKLTESLAAPMLARIRSEYEERLEQKDADFAKRITVLKQREEDLNKAQESIDAQVAAKIEQEREQLNVEAMRRLASIQKREAELAHASDTLEERLAAQLKEERAKIVADEARKAKLALGTDLEQKERDLGELRQLLEERNTKLLEAQRVEAEALKKQRQLDDALRELDLTVEKRTQAGIETVREQARKEAAEDSRLKLVEKEQQIASMNKQIEELKRKGEQGSQQLQGEAQELVLEATLRAGFSRDTIEPVPKGEHGGDVLHRVLGPSGNVSGTIIWESKRTKNWSDGWLAKLRDDQRAAKADVAVIVSQVLPKDIDGFGLVEGVWVAHPRVVIPIATMLRVSLIEVAMARQSMEGHQTKTEMLYEYMTGPRFRQRVHAIIEAFDTMRDDLDKEKKAITKQWAKRDEQITRVMHATAGMYGDLQGIAGQSMQEIDGLDLAALGDGS